MDAPASGDIKDFYRIIAIDGGEHAITFIVDSHVVETALNIWHRNDPHQNQWGGLVIRRHLRYCSARPPKHHDQT